MSAVFSPVVNVTPFVPEKGIDEQAVREEKNEVATIEKNPSIRKISSCLDIYLKSF